MGLLFSYKETSDILPVTCFANQEKAIVTVIITTLVSYDSNRLDYSLM